MWGENDHIFPADGAHPYKHDLENFEFHLLDPKKAIQSLLQAV
jgi:hypothetical protein